MNFYKLTDDLPIPIKDGMSDHLLNSKLPEVSLPNQDGNLLKINRDDTFRLVLYFYPMTGNPNKHLPENWNSIPGARGCTPQTCSFRDHYDDLIKLNALPIGVTTQSIEDIKEMVVRLKVPYDVLSDQKLLLTNALKLPTFKVKNRIFIKRLTLIISKSYIQHVFYPIFPPHEHIKDVLDWLKKN